MDYNGVFVQIPARSGSKRVPRKNLRYLGNKPLIGYAIEAIKQAKVAESNNIFINTDDKDLFAYGIESGINAYLRNPENATDTATGDDFTYEFICQFRPKTLLMVSPVCPLISATTIATAYEAFCASDCDTLISCDETKMQGFVEDDPINVDVTQPLPPSQFNRPIRILNWAITIWDADNFVKQYDYNKSGYLGTNRMLFPIDKNQTIKISEEEDFRQAERFLGVAGGAKPAYWSDKR